MAFVMRAASSDTARTGLRSPVLVLNRGYQPVRITDARNGFSMLYLGRARALDADYEPHDFAEWIEREQLPGTPAGQCLGFAPLPLPDDAPANTPRIGVPEDRSLLLYFLEADPRDCWTGLFAPAAEQLAAEGLGRISYASAFLPTVPGTDRYTDELW